MAVTAIVSAMVVSAGVSYYNGQEAKKSQEAAMNQAKAEADRSATMQQEQINKANAKTPDVNAIMAANSLSAKSGGGGTMLTGPQGVDPNSLSLGKNTLLGA